MDINVVINQAVEKTISDKLPSIIEEKVGNLVDGILSDVFKTYSDVGKSIKNRIESGLDINLQRFDLVDYNAFVGNAINTHLAKCLNEGSMEPIFKLVEDTVGFVTAKELPLSAICERIKSAAMGNSDDESGEITFIAEVNTEHKWVTVYADIEPDKSIWDCAIEFLFSNDSGKGSIFVFRTNSKWYKGRESLSPRLLTQMDAIQHEIFRLYSAQTKIIFDTDCYDTEWCKYD